MTDYQPLVQYQQNKDFVGLMNTLMDVVEKLQERNNLNEGEYLDMANLCKDLYNAKKAVETHYIYIEMVRRANKNPPKPPRAVDKLNDPDFMVCEFCDKALHKKYITTHQELSKTCLRHRQAKQSCVVEKLPKISNDLKPKGKLSHKTIQAFNLQLAHKNDGGEPEPRRLDDGNFVNIKSVIFGGDSEILDKMNVKEVARLAYDLDCKRRKNVGASWMEEDGKWEIFGNIPTYKPVQEIIEKAIGNGVIWEADTEWMEKMIAMNKMEKMTKKFWLKTGIDLRKAKKANTIPIWRYDDCENKLKALATKFGFNK